MPERTSVLVNDYAGHPFQIELSTELSMQNLDVTHTYCSSNVTPRGDLSEVDGGPSIVSISTGDTFDKYSLHRRLLAELRYGIASARLMRRVRPDVSLNSNVPVFSLVTITLAAKLLRIRNVLWLQDLQAGLVAFTLGNDKHPVARIVGLLERWCIRQADHVVTISPGFEREVLTIGVPEHRVTTIPNWAPIDDIPSRPRNNEWSERHGLDGRLVFMYSGTLGVKHRPEALVALAQEIANVDPDAVIVVVSEGVGAEWLSEESARLGLDNVMLLPFQPFEDLPDVLASGDALIALLEPDAGEFSVPSKVLTYLCAGRAVLGLMPSANAASELVRNHARSGLVANDIGEFIDNARTMATNENSREAFGASGRAYAEAEFEISRITKEFKELLMPERVGADGNPRITNNGVLT